MEHNRFPHGLANSAQFLCVNLINFQIVACCRIETGFPECEKSGIPGFEEK